MVNIHAANYLKTVTTQCDSPAHPSSAKIYIGIEKMTVAMAGEQSAAGQHQIDPQHPTYVADLLGR